MGSELVSTTLSSDRVGASVSTSTTPKSYSEVFEEVFPYYLSIGMSESQFWDCDSTLAKAYRQAFKIKTERNNQEMWLMGAYIYDALLRVSPIYQAFAKKGTKPLPYVNEPYSLGEKQEEMKREEKAKREQEIMFEKMKAFMIDNNKKYVKE